MQPLVSFDASSGNHAARRRVRRAMRLAALGLVLFLGTRMAVKETARLQWAGHGESYSSARRVSPADRDLRAVAYRGSEYRAY